MHYSSIFFCNLLPHTIQFHSVDVLSSCSIETFYNGHEHQASSYPRSTLILTSFVCREKLVAVKLATRVRKFLTADK